MPLNTKHVIGQLEELNKKLVKGAENLKSIEEVDVGTAPRDVVYEEDRMKLYHYRQEEKVTCKVPLLIVYALVNREYVLDLQPDRSVVRNLLHHGMDLYITDWGYPTRADRYLSLDDYVDIYLNDFVDFIRDTTGNEKINLMGICQGGTFSVIYSALYPQKVKNLVTLATPIDFSVKDGLLYIWAKDIDIDRVVDNYGVVPGSAMNTIFLRLKPITLSFGSMMYLLNSLEDKERLLNFLRIDRWAFDSPSQAGEYLRKFVNELYKENRLIKGELTIGNKRVDLKKITMPLLNIYASLDHLVPPGSARPLNDVVGSKDKEFYEYKGGHIGLFVSSRSQKDIAPAISEWLHKRAG